jgi:hypothetical protein
MTAYVPILDLALFDLEDGKRRFAEYGYCMFTGEREVDARKPETTTGWGSTECRTSSSLACLS